MAVAEMAALDVDDGLSASGGQYFCYATKVLDEKGTWGERVEDFVFVSADVIGSFCITK